VVSVLIRLRSSRDISSKQMRGHHGRLTAAAMERFLETLLILLLVLAMTAET